MFPRRERLTQKEFNEVFARGRRLHSPCFQIITSSAVATKVAVVVPKKLINSAVGRNRLRRRVTHVLKEVIGELPYHGVCIVICKAGVLTSDPVIWRAELSKTLG